MAGLLELQQLKSLFANRRSLMEKYNQLNDRSVAKMRSYYKSVQPLKKYWFFTFIEQGTLVAASIAGIYLIAYFVSMFFILVAAFVLSIPLWIFDGIFRSDVGSIFDKAIYYIGFPANWFGGLFLPWIRNAEVNPADFNIVDVAYVLVGALIFVLVAFLVFLILDLIIMLLRNPIAKVKNREIKKDNFLNALVGDTLYEEYQKTQEYADEMTNIRNTRLNIADNERRIKNNTAVHSDYKDEATVIKLISYIARGRARDTREAINLLHSERREDARDRIALAQLEEQKVVRMINERDAQRNDDYRRAMLEETREQTRAARNAESNTDLTNSLIIWDMFTRK